MKKPFRLILFILGGTALLCLLGVGLAFTPTVQTWAARRAVTGLPGVKIEIGRIAIGLNSVHVDNLRISQPGLRLALPSVDLELPVIAAARGQVRIAKLSAKDWTLDLTATGAPAGKGGSSSAPAAAVAGSSVATFAGIFQLLHLPVDLSLDAADLEGDVTRPDGRAHVVLKGGGLGAGRDASFTLNAAVTSAGGAAASVSTVTVLGRLTAHMDTPRLFSSLGLTADVTAAGPKLGQGVPAHLVVVASRDGQVEHYEVTVAQGGPVSNQLAHFELAVPASGQTPLSGRASLHATDADLAPLAMGHDLPGFKADGECAFTLSRDFSKIDASGKLEGTVEKLELLRSDLATLGRQAFAVDFAATHQGDVTQVSRLKLTVGGEKPIVSVEALQSFNFNAANGKLEAANAAADLMHVDLVDLPLAWAQPALPPGVQIQGGVLGAQLQASARDGGFMVRSTSPLVLGHVTLTQAGRPTLNDATLTCTLSADDTPAGWKVAVTDGAVRSKDATLCTFSTEIGQVLGQGAPVKATGSLVVDFPSLAGQPAAGAISSLAHGTATIAYTAVVGDKSGLDLKLDLKNLTAADQTKLADVSLEARADVAVDGGLALNIPATVSLDGRISALALGGTISAAQNGGRTVDLQLKGDALYLDDLLPLVSGLGGQATPGPAAVGSSLPPAQTPPVAGAPVPAGAPWAGVAGTVKYDFKKVVFSPEWQASVKGSVKADPGAVALEASGILGADAPFSATTQLTYAAAGIPPYGLTADVKLNNFDTAPLLKTVEGRADFAAQLASAAVTPAGLADGLQGKVVVTSKGGVCRLLAVTEDKSGLVQSATGVGASLLGNLVGAVAGNKAGANAATALTQIAGLLREIRYDQLNLTVSRDAKENIVLEDFNLIAPDVRLAGHGQVQHVAGSPVLEQPLTLQLAVAAQGSLGHAMSAVGLLGETPDNLGYLPLVLDLPELGGTLQKPDTNAFYKELAKRAGQKAAERVTNGVSKGAGAFLNGLLGK